MFGIVLGRATKESIETLLHAVTTTSRSSTRLSDALVAAVAVVRALDQAKRRYEVPDFPAVNSPLSHFPCEYNSMFSYNSHRAHNYRYRQNEHIVIRTYVHVSSVVII